MKKPVLFCMQMESFSEAEDQKETLLGNYSSAFSFASKSGIFNLAFGT